MNSLRAQKEALPIGASVIATEACPPYYPAGAHGIVLKHYHKGSVMVRFARSSGAMVGQEAGLDWFAAPEKLKRATP